MRTLLILLLFIFPATAFAQSEDEALLSSGDEFAEELIHSDLPLYGFDWEEFWPRSSIPEGSIAGCASRVNVGDWKFQPDPRNEYADEWWWRLRNYGTFHCAAIITDEYAREDLSEGPSTTGFFARIGIAAHEGGPIELWVLQRGARPGSEYVLLAREPDEDIIQEFTVLQRRCPEGAMRVFEGNLDIVRTDYCAINSRDALFNHAVAMLTLPPLGTVIRQHDSDNHAQPTSDNDHVLMHNRKPVESDGSFLLKKDGEEAK